MNASRTGLFIIRAWVEPGSSSPLRAQIRLTTDVSQGLQQSLTVAEKAAVVEVIQTWLSEILAGERGVGDEPDSP